MNADVRARVSGYLISQNYKEGAVVNKGDLLFQVDPSVYEAAVEEAKASVAQAEANQLQAEQTEQRETQLMLEQLQPLTDRRRAHAQRRGRGGERRRALELEQRLQQLIVHAHARRLAAGADAVVAGQRRDRIGTLRATGALTAAVQGPIGVERLELRRVGHVDGDAALVRLGAAAGDPDAIGDGRTGLRGRDDLGDLIVHRAAFIGRALATTGEHEKSEA